MSSDFLTYCKESISLSVLNLNDEAEESEDAYYCKHDVVLIGKYDLRYGESKRYAVPDTVCTNTCKSESLKPLAEKKCDYNNNYCCNDANNKIALGVSGNGCRKKKCVEENVVCNKADAASIRKEVNRSVEESCNNAYYKANYESVSEEALYKGCNEAYTANEASCEECDELLKSEELLTSEGFDKRENEKHAYNSNCRNGCEKFLCLAEECINGGICENLIEYCHFLYLFPDGFTIKIYRLSISY